MAIVRDVLERHDLATTAGTKRTAEEAVIEESLPPAKRRKATMTSLPADETQHLEVITVFLFSFDGCVHFVYRLRRRLAPE